MLWGTAVARAKVAVTKRAGLLPPREVKVRVLRAHRTVQLRWAEGVEVRRARRTLGRPLPNATTVTVIPSIGRSTLVDAVRSALAQSVTDHHVIVVGDGRLVPALPPDPRLSVVVLRRRYGLPALPRNVGLRATSSTYLAFLDDDNTWAPDHLERALPILEGGADLTYTAVQWVADDGALLGTLSVPFDRRALREQNFVDSNAIVVRRSRQARFRVIPRRRGDSTFEDWELAWRISRRGRVVHVPAATARVLVHDGSDFMVPRADQVREEPSVAIGD